MDTNAFAQYSAASAQAERPCARSGQCSLAQCLLCCARAVFSDCGSGTTLSILSEVNHQLESRMRENRLSGSEGGGILVLPTPIFGGDNSSGRHFGAEVAPFLDRDFACADVHEDAVYDDEE